MKGNFNRASANVLLLTVLVAVLCFSGCASLKKTPGSKGQYITAEVNGKKENYIYKISGLYDTAQHKLTLKASDTTLEESRFWVINVELGKQQNLKNLNLPRTFSYQADPGQRQVIFANIFADRQDGNMLYDNYTWRRNSDLVVTLQSYKKNFLTGTFSGSLGKPQNKLQITNGSFRIKLIEK